MHCVLTFDCFISRKTVERKMVRPVGSQWRGHLSVKVTARDAPPLRRGGRNRDQITLARCCCTGWWKLIYMTTIRHVFTFGQSSSGRQWAPDIIERWGRVAACAQRRRRWVWCSNNRRKASGIHRHRRKQWELKRDRASLLDGRLETTLAKKERNDLLFYLVAVVMKFQCETKAAWRTHHHHYSAEQCRSRIRCRNWWSYVCSGAKTLFSWRSEKH